MNKKIDAFYVEYDGYNQNNELVKQGFITMFKDRRKANELILKLNEEAAKDGYKINFYRTYRKALEESYNYHVKNFNLKERLERLFITFEEERKTLMNNKKQLDKIPARPVKPSRYKIVGKEYNFILAPQKNGPVGQPRYRLIKEGGPLKGLDTVYMNQYKKGYYLIESYHVRESILNILDQLNFKIEATERIE